MYKVFRFVVFGLVGVGVMSGCSDAASRAKIDLVDLAESNGSDWSYLDAVDVTDDVCPDLGCVQAVKSPYISVLKFPSVREAAEYEKGCDCQAIDPIVVHFDGKQVTEEERRDIIYTLSNTNVDDEW